MNVARTVLDRAYRESFKMKIQSILVPIDYSACSAAALGFAAEFAQKLGAKIDVLHVWEGPAYVTEDVKVVRHGDESSLIELIRNEAQAELLQFVAKQGLAATVSMRLLSGNPAATVLSELHQRKHDLLIVGTHGRTGLVHVLLGSVAEKLVRLSPVPVITVPHSKSAQREPSRTD